MIKKEEMTDSQEQTVESQKKILEYAKIIDDDSTPRGEYKDAKVSLFNLARSSGLTVPQLQCLKRTNFPDKSSSVFSEHQVLYATSMLKKMNFSSSRIWSDVKVARNKKDRMGRLVMKSMVSVNSVVLHAAS